jgi:hypothetical protein
MLRILMGKKKNLVQAAVKRSKNQRWNVFAEGEKLGQADTLCDATSMLYAAGYKVGAYRRHEQNSGKSGFTAACIKFNPKKEEV